MNGNGPAHTAVTYSSNSNSNSSVNLGGSSMPPSRLNGIGGGYSMNPSLQRDGQSYGSGGGGGGRSINNSSNNDMQAPASSMSNPAGPSASSSSKPPTNSPEEIESSRRIARTHYEEFKLFLEQEGMRGQSS